MRIAVVLIGRHSVDHLDGLGVVAAVSSQVRCTATTAFSLRGMTREFSRAIQHSVIVNICPLKFQFLYVGTQIPNHQCIVVILTWIWIPKRPYKIPNMKIPTRNVPEGDKGL